MTAGGMADKLYCIFRHKTSTEDHDDPNQFPRAFLVLSHLTQTNELVTD